jgi:hypothetical protein
MSSAEERSDENNAKGAPAPKQEQMHDFNIGRIYALRTGGGRTKNVSRRACRNLRGGCVTAASKLDAVRLNAHMMTSRIKGNTLTGARRVLIADLVWVYADGSSVWDCSFLESSFAIGT